MSDNYQIEFSNLDGELLAKLESVISPHENLLWIGKPVFIPFVFRNFIAGLPFSIFGAFWALGCILDDKRYLSLLGVLCIYLGVKDCVLGLYAHSKTVFGLSQSRILTRNSGFGGVSYQTLDLKDISEATVTISLLEKMYNVGTIRFFTGKTTIVDERKVEIYDYWHSIENPYEVYEIVSKAMFERKESNKKKSKKKNAEKHKHIRQKSSGYKLDYD